MAKYRERETAMERKTGRLMERNRETVFAATDDKVNWWN